MAQIDGIFEETQMESNFKREKSLRELCGNEKFRERFGEGIDFEEIKKKILESCVRTALQPVFDRDSKFRKFFLLNNFELLSNLCGVPLELKNQIIEEGNQVSGYVMHELVAQRNTINSDNHDFYNPNTFSVKFLQFFKFFFPHIS